MNRLVKIYRIDVSSMKDTTPSQKEKLKQIRKYDYVSRKSVFRFLWLGEELNKHQLEMLYTQLLHSDFQDQGQCATQYHLQ